MKHRAIFFVFTLVAGCQIGLATEVIFSQGVGPLVHYSRYFENDKVNVAGKLLVHGVITLGQQRMPKGYDFRRDPRFSDGSSPAVLEFYFTNQTDEPLKLAVESFSCRLFGDAPISTSTNVAPRGYVKSKPLIAFTSNFVTRPWDYSVVLVIDGHRYPLADKLARISRDQLKIRNGKKG
jgi:hypothetical protein